MTIMGANNLFVSDFLGPWKRGPLVEEFMSNTCFWSRGKPLKKDYFFSGCERSITVDTGSLRNFNFCPYCGDRMGFLELWGTLSVVFGDGSETPTDNF